MLCVKHWKELKKKTPEELLESYNLENEAPVDIEKLLKALGISAMGTDFSKLEKLLNKPENSILGAMISSGENAAIFTESQTRTIENASQSPTN